MWSYLRGEFLLPLAFFLLDLSGYLTYYIDGIRSGPLNVGPGNLGRTPKVPLAEGEDAVAEKAARKSVV